MMLGEVLLAQFVLHCIVRRPHCIHKMRACICRWVYVLVDVSESCHLCCLTLTGKVLQPANLSSSAHLEPVFMYKGAQVLSSQRVRT